MPRKTQEEKSASRERIVEAAAYLIRKKGIDDTSLTDVMRRAGMTHGGFYRHFRSKDDLVASAISEAFQAGLYVFDADGQSTSKKAIKYAEQYLTDKHVNSPELGCPIPLLSAEISRGRQNWKEAFENGVSRAVEGLSEAEPDHSRKEALVRLSTLVGALVIARGLANKTLHTELMEAVRSSLLKEEHSGN